MTDPIKDLAEEADRGRSERTPLLALSGVTIAVTALVAVILAIVVLAFVLT